MKAIDVKKSHAAVFQLSVTFIQQSLAFVFLLRFKVIVTSYSLCLYSLKPNKHQFHVFEKIEVL